MKAVVYERTGPAEVLTQVERPIPLPGSGEVRVRVAVSGVNPTDWKARRGSGSSTILAEPQIPGQDGAGTVDALGSGVQRLAVGQRVWLWQTAWNRTDGTMQEYTVVPERLAVALPDTASFDTGASLGIPALTAHHTLTAHEGGPSRLSPGSLAGTTVLVAGGAGAVGHAAIQLAHWAGARVITTVSSDEKAELARAAGADHVVNYRAEDAAARIHTLAPEGVDVVVEVNAAANLQLDLDVLAPSGTISIYAAESAPLDVPMRPSMTKNVRYQFVLTYTTSDEEKENAVAAVSEALADGALEVGEDHGLPLIRFPLAEAADAQRAVEDGAVGKVLVDVTGA